jgi:hypothetical protein
MQSGDGRPLDTGPRSGQKRRAIEALFAREWFRENGPPDAPPLPLSGLERRELMYRDPLSHVVSCFGLSLRGQNYDTERHPSFETFARGALASRYAPRLLKEAETLKERYPPRELPGLGPGLCWQPDHAMVRRSQSKRLRCRDR